MRHDRCELIMMALLKRLGADVCDIEISNAEIEAMRGWTAHTEVVAPATAKDVWRVRLKKEFFDV